VGVSISYSISDTKIRRIFFINFLIFGAKKSGEYLYKKIRRIFLYKKSGEYLCKKIRKEE